MASSTVSGCPSGPMSPMRSSRPRYVAGVGVALAGTRRPTGRRAASSYSVRPYPLAAIGELAKSASRRSWSVESRIGLVTGRSLRRSGRLAVDEPAPVADRAQLVLRVLGVADHAAVVDQQHVRRVHLVGLEQAEEQVVRLVGGRLGRDEPDRAATTRSTWRSTGISGVPKQNSSTIEAVFLPMPSMAVSQSRASIAGSAPRNSSE